MSQGRRVADFGISHLDLPTRRDAEPARPPRARKDRRRWCRGRVGVPHDPSGWRPVRYAYARGLEPRQAMRVCLACGKHLEQDFWMYGGEEGRRWWWGGGYSYEEALRRRMDWLRRRTAEILAA